MINSFDTNVALDVGINAAILYKNIQYWCEKNETNEQNFHDGHYWTYNSLAAFCSQFPYLTKRQVEVALKTLEEKEYIKSGNFNKASYDRTKWYTDIKNVKCISHGCEMDCANMGNGIHIDVKPIPNINTNINTNEEDIYIEDKPKKTKRFIPPTIDEVRAYCEERNNLVDPEKFLSYYSSTNWYRGKTKITDWKACVRTWERNNYSEKNKPAPKSGNPFTELLKEEGYI